VDHSVGIGVGAVSVLQLGGLHGRKRRERLHEYMHICYVYISHMYIYAYVCMYACMYVCMYACMYVYIHTYMHTHVCMYAYACMYVCIHVSMCMYIHGIFMYTYGIFIAARNAFAKY